MSFKKRQKKQVWLATGIKFYIDLGRTSIETKQIIEETVKYQDILI